MTRSKEASSIPPAAPHLPLQTLSSLLLSSPAPKSPTNHGKISLIVQRPALNTRKVVPSAHFSILSGMEGSGWELREERGTIDQICVMSTVAISAIAGPNPEHWAPAGDQLFVDLDLAKDNLKEGDRVTVGNGGVVLEVTTKPHNGCPKFAKRYGLDALKVVNGTLGRERRLRGIYFRVVEEGIVNVGDDVVKVE